MDVIGDSHVEVFNILNIKQKKYRFNVKLVGGTTIYGINNDDSKTKSKTIFMDFIKKSNSKYLLIGAGEVDCNYLCIYKYKRDKLDPIQYINKCMNNYYNFLSEIIKIKKYKNIIIICPHYPTVLDRHPGNPERRNNIGIVPYSIRLKITKILNIKIKELVNYLNNIINCVNIQYIDINDEIIDENEKIKDEFKLENISDHHLNMESVVPIFNKKLRICFNKIDD